MEEANIELLEYQIAEIKSMINAKFIDLKKEYDELKVITDIANKHSDTMYAGLEVHINDLQKRCGLRNGGATPIDQKIALLEADVTNIKTNISDRFEDIVDTFKRMDKREEKREEREHQMRLALERDRKVRNRWFIGLAVGIATTLIGYLASYIS